MRCSSSVTKSAEGQNLPQFLRQDESIYLRLNPDDNEELDSSLCSTFDLLRLGNQGFALLYELHFNFFKPWDSRDE